jgi:hypothetical protein
MGVVAHTGNAVWDGVASICVGALLGVTALTLVQLNHKVFTPLSTSLFAFALPLTHLCFCVCVFAQFLLGILCPADRDGSGEQR